MTLEKSKAFGPFAEAIAKCDEIQRLLKNAQSNSTHTPEIARAQLESALGKILELSREVESARDIMWK